MLSHISRRMINKKTNQIIAGVQGYGPAYKPRCMIATDVATNTSIRIERKDYSQWLECYKVGDRLSDSCGRRQTIVAIQQKTKNTVLVKIEHTWHGGHPNQGHIEYSEEILEGRAA